MVKEFIKYKCLSKKDKVDLKKWNKPKNIKKKIIKPKVKSEMDNLSDKIKGKSYTKFLNSEYWQIVRTKVLKRDNHECIICKSKEKLEVHHDTYKNHFNEHKHLEDLMTLCRKCHTEHHYSN